MSFIQSLNLSPKELLVLGLETHPKFYLTGSRFFGIQGSASDWDFYCTHNRQNADYLFAKGFKITDSYTYANTDFNIAEVYHHKDFDIHVQMVQSVMAKDKAQNFIKQHMMTHPGMNPDNPSRKRDILPVWAALQSM